MYKKQQKEVATNHASVLKWSQTWEHFKKQTKERQWWFSSTESLYRPSDILKHSAINHSIDQSNDWLIDQPNHSPINQPINHYICSIKNYQ